MSRIGKKPIIIPPKVSLKIDRGEISVSGPLGTLSIKLPQNLEVIQRKGNLIIKRKKEDKSSRSLHGLYRQLIENQIQGVTVGYKKVLEIKGVGYKALLEGNELILSVGFSHPIKISAPRGISFSVEKNHITVSGIDKQLVGQISAQIRSVSPPDPYKGKGIRYLGEEVRRKLGKQVKVFERGE